MKRLVLAALVVVGLGACDQATIDRIQGALSTTTTVPSRAQAPGLARPLVAEPDPARARYVRDEWQPGGWDDADGDGCNTRYEVLIAEAVAPPTVGARCRLVGGTWADPYTGRNFPTIAELQIDHLVALSDAHASGGWRWGAERKVAFANNLADEHALNAVDGGENQRKSDEGPDQWSPPNASYRCTYLAAYARIKAEWGLTVTAAQWAAIEKGWAAC